MDIRLPNITAPTESGQIAQMRAYLYQFAEQLNWALNTLESNKASDAVVLKDKVGNIVEQTEEAKAMDTFNSLKPLIIKSAEIVESYYDKIDELINLSGRYVAYSEYGTYTQDTNNRIDATDRYIQQNLYTKETIDEMFVENQGYLRFGVVGTTIYPPNENATGIIIGDFTSTNESEYKRFARYTSAGIELFDGEAGGDNLPVATISKKKITITSAEFTSEVKMGQYRVDLSNGIAFKWEGV